MKRLFRAHQLVKIISMVACLATLPSSLWAQEKEPEKEPKPVKNNILEVLQSPIMGQGVIRLFQSQDIANRVGASLFGLGEGSGKVTVQGYRVQLYSGNASHSKAVASARANQVRLVFPELETTIQYEAPFWRLRVGAFLQREEAREYLQELKKEFPTFAKEMYVVRAMITVVRGNE